MHLHACIALILGFGGILIFWKIFLVIIIIRKKTQLKLARVMSARSVRTLIRDSSALLSIAYEYGRPISLNFIQKRRIRCSIRDDQLYVNRLIQSLAPIRPQKNKKASLVIFDKDGTLICFHATWVPWAVNVAKRISKAINVNVEKEIYSLLGLQKEEQRVQSGLLAEGTMAQIHDAIARLLINRGIEAAEAVKYVMVAVLESNESSGDSAKEIFDLRSLFRQLQDNGIKIAICTSDSRKGTMTTLRRLRLEDYIDMTVCGDDAGSMPKPHPHNALSICRALDVDPQDALIVGDTLADMGMGRSANLGSTVGVLSGVCGINELRPQADHIVHDVGELLPIVLDMTSATDIIVPCCDMMLNLHNLPKSLCNNVNDDICFISSFISPDESHLLPRDDRR
ncbi:Pyrophosphatase PpaX [Dirofilaria immitis]